MSICDDIRDWKDMTPNERFQSVRDWIKQSANGWGFGDDVKVMRQAPPGGADRRGGYDPDNDTIYLHPQIFTKSSDDGWKSAYDTAAHETAHHVQDEMDDAYAEDPEDADSDPDAGFDGETDDGDAGDDADDGDDGGPTDGGVIDLHDDARHAEATDFADAFLAAAAEACEEDPEGAESAIKSFLGEWLMERGAAEPGEPSPVGDWESPGDTRVA